MPPTIDECLRFENEIEQYLADHADPAVPACLLPTERETLVSLKQDLMNFVSDMEQLPSLGMIGNMTSAKTSCVELLLGAVGKLGVCQQMGTTNAVEYRVRSDPGTVQTTFENYRCEFQTEEELRNLLPDFRNAILGQAPTVYGDANYSQIQEFAFDQNNADGTDNPNHVDKIFQQPDWNKLRRWTLKMIEIVPADCLPNLSNALYELHWLVKSGFYGNAWFGKRLRISDSQARELSVSDGNGGVGRINNLQQEYINPFPDTPDCEPDEYGYLTTPADTICNELRYLVKIIRVDVKVPVATNRFTVGGGLRLVDVPGLGSAGSMIRDKAIMKELLPSLNGILYMLDTDDRVFLSEGVQLLQNCQALERTVVVCSKFDKIELPKADDLENVGWNLEQNLYNVSNWGSFNDLVHTFKQYWTNFSSMVPFSLFYFLACETNEFDQPNQNLACAFADGNFLNNDTGDYCRYRFHRDAVRRSLQTIIQNLQAANQAAQANGVVPEERGQIVEMLQNFYEDGGASRLFGAYQRLLANAALANRQYQLDMTWNALRNRFTNLCNQVDARNQNGAAPNVANVSSRAIQLIGRWNSAELWEGLKANVKECLNNNKKLEKPVFLAHLFLLPFWEEIYNSRMIWGGNFDYELQINGQEGGVNIAPLVNEPGRDIPQDTQELFVAWIDEYYENFVNGICERLCANGGYNPSVKTLNNIFDDVKNTFQITNDERNYLIGFSALMNAQNDLIDKFGIVQNDWNDPQRLNFYELLSQNFVGRCSTVVENLKNDNVTGWNLPSWREEKYPLQLTRAQDGSSPLKFPWNSALHQQFALNLDNHPTLRSEKLSLERVRELRYQLQKACDYLVEEMYSRLEVNFFYVLDTMKKDLGQQIKKWEKNGNFGGLPVGQQPNNGGFVRRRVPRPLI